MRGFRNGHEGRLHCAGMCRAPPLTGVGIAAHARPDGEVSARPRRTTAALRRHQPHAPGEEDHPRLHRTISPSPRFVYKTIADPFVGKLISVPASSPARSPGRTDAVQRRARTRPKSARGIYILRGKKQIAVSIAARGRHRRAGQAAVHLHRRHALRHRQAHSAIRRIEYPAALHFARRFTRQKAGRGRQGILRPGAPDAKKIRPSTLAKNR